MKKGTLWLQQRNANTQAQMRCNRLAAKRAKQQSTVYSRMERFLITPNTIGQRAGRLHQDHIKKGGVAASKGTGSCASQETYDDVKYQYECDGVNVKRPVYASKPNMQT